MFAQSAQGVPPPSQINSLLTLDASISLISRNDSMAYANILYECTKYNIRPTSGTCAHRGNVMAPTAGFLGAERVLQKLRGLRGQDDAAETGRRATP